MRTSQSGLAIAPVPMESGRGSHRRRPHGAVAGKGHVGGLAEWPEGWVGARVGARAAGNVQSAILLGPEPQLSDLVDQGGIG